VRDEWFDEGCTYLYADALGGHDPKPVELAGGPFRHRVSGVAASSGVC